MTCNIFYFVLVLCLNPASTDETIERMLQDFWADRFGDPAAREQIHDVYVHENTAAIVHEFDISYLWKSGGLYKEDIINNKTCHGSVALYQFCEEYQHGINGLKRKFTPIWKELRELIGKFQQDQRIESNPASSLLAHELIGKLGEDESEWRTYFRTDAFYRFNHLLVATEQVVYNISTSDLVHSYVDLLRNMHSVNDMEFPKYVAKTLVVEKEKRLSELVRRLSSGITECNRGHIPFQNWDWEYHKTTLTQLQEIVDVSGLNLAIPVKRFEDYANFDMASCFFTKSTMRIWIYIPVIRKHVHWNLYKLTVGPFDADGEMGELAYLGVLENTVAETNGKYYFFNAMDRSRCDLRPRGLCLILESLFDDADAIDVEAAKKEATEKEKVRVTVVEL